MFIHRYDFLFGQTFVYCV